jgi:hypothetical protein
MSIKITGKNAKVIELTIAQDQYERIKEMISRLGGTPRRKREIIRQVTGYSPCYVCGVEIPTIQISYPVGDSKQALTRVENYCGKCQKSVFERIKDEPTHSKELAESYGLTLVDHVPPSPKEYYHKKRSV